MADADNYIGQPGHAAAAAASPHHDRPSTADEGGGEENMPERAGHGCAVLRGIFGRNLSGYKPQAPPSYGDVSLEQCCGEALDGGLGCTGSLGREHEGIQCSSGENSATRGTDQMSVESYIANARKKSKECSVSAQRDLFELRHAGTVSASIQRVHIHVGRSKRERCGPIVYSPNVVGKNMIRL